MIYDDSFYKEERAIMPQHYQLSLKVANFSVVRQQLTHSLPSTFIGISINLFTF